MVANLLGYLPLGALVFGAAVRYHLFETRLSGEFPAGGEGLAADGPFVRGWLDHLNGLQVGEFVKDVVTDFSGYGLAPPARPASRSC